MSYRNTRILVTALVILAVAAVTFLALTLLFPESAAADSEVRRTPPGVKDDPFGTGGGGGGGGGGGCVYCWVNVTQMRGGVARAPTANQLNKINNWYRSTLRWQPVGEPVEVNSPPHTYWQQFKHEVAP